MSKPTFQSAPAKIKREQYEFYTHLYLHSMSMGFSRNQAKIVDRQLRKSFGSTFVNDWPLYDGLFPNGKVIARAQGLHIQAGTKTHSMSNSFNIVFERHSNLSLQVMGPVVEQGEWAIVGGTGQFRLAKGVIYKTLDQKKPDGYIVELDIHCFIYERPPWNLEPPP